MELKNYLTLNEISVERFAKLLEVERATVCRYLLRVRKPDPEVMTKIYEITNGAVQPNDFYDLPNINTNESS